LPLFYPGAAFDAKRGRNIRARISLSVFGETFVASLYSLGTVGLHRVPPGGGKSILRYRQFYELALRWAWVWGVLSEGIICDQQKNAG
jgi:hypothetical protein